MPCHLYYYHFPSAGLFVVNLFLAVIFDEFMTALELCDCYTTVTWPLHGRYMAATWLLYGCFMVGVVAIMY